MNEPVPPPEHIIQFFGSRLHRKVSAHRSGEYLSPDPHPTKSRTAGLTRPVELRTGVEVYGHRFSPRIKWSCISCGKRNDHKVLLPISPKEVRHCVHCKRPTMFQAEPKASTKFQGAGMLSWGPR